MVYVTIARGALLGSCVMITKHHFPELFAVVERCSSLLQLPMPMVFVRDDIHVPVVAVGFGDPYSLIVSSHWLDHFKEDELTFMIGRELGHIAAGHTRLTSILSVNGRENAIISLIFGAWLRRTEFTADRVGLLCCGSTEAAYRAIALCEFHLFARKVDLAAFAQQRAEIAHDSVLRLGEWLSPNPYATNRMESLRVFHHTALYDYWEERLLAQPVKSVPVQHRSDRVTKQDCASFGRRLAAIAIDYALVSATASLVVTSTGVHSPGIHWNVNFDPGPGAMFLLYNMVLVAIAGQTFGMMIVSVRVTNMHFERPRPLQVVWRYLIAVPLFVLSVLWPGFWRVELHDRASGTRLVGLERTLQRTALPA
ncbi:MAG TPA: RDD family protein [Candidatus Rubrimentiphilum sp.]|nr:RDD family protein [Candidatus Rubrimentiphilum sp.]